MPVSMPARWLAAVLASPPRASDIGVKRCRESSPGPVGPCGATRACDGIRSPEAGARSAIVAAFLLRDERTKRRRRGHARRRCRSKSRRWRYFRHRCRFPGAGTSPIGLPEPLQAPCERRTGGVPQNQGRPNLTPLPQTPLLEEDAVQTFDVPGRVGRAIRGCAAWLDPMEVVEALCPEWPAPEPGIWFDYRL